MPPTTKQHRLDEADPDVIVLRRDDGTLVAAFSARDATKEELPRGCAGRLQGTDRTVRVSAERPSSLASRGASKRAMSLTTAVIAVGLRSVSLPTCTATGAYGLLPYAASRSYAASRWASGTCGSRSVSEDWSLTIDKPWAKNQAPKATATTKTKTSTICNVPPPARSGAL